MKENWKKIWVRKGMESGGIDNLEKFDGYEKTQINMEDVVNRITEVMNIKESDAVLEIGCGAGALARYLKCKYVGIDYSETLVKKHIEILKNSVLIGEAAELPFKDKIFDKVIAYGVFMYFDDYEYTIRVIKEMVRVARKALFIGDLPMNSHSDYHLLFKRHFFEDSSLVILKGFYEPYSASRFNVYGNISEMEKNRCIEKIYQRMLNG